jgi:hypothetical protein
MKKARTLRELFSFPGFYTQRQLQGVFGDPKARIVQLKRQKKAQSVQGVGRATADTTIQKYDRYGIRMRWNGESISDLNNDGYCALIVEVSKWNTSIG